MDQFIKNGGKDNMADILASSIVVIVSVQFIKKAEGIVREIFAFKDDSSNTSLASGVATAAFTVQMIKSTGGAAKAIKNGAQNFIPGAKNLFHQGKVNIAMMRDSATLAAAVGASSAGTGGTTTQKADSGNNHEEEEKKSAAERYQEKRRLAEMYVSKQEADKFQKKIQGKLSSEAHSKIDDKIQKKKADLIAQSGGKLTEQEALQQARRSVLKEEKDKRSFINSNKTIVGVRRGVNKVTGAYNKSALMQMARDRMKNSVAIGVGALAATGAYSTSNGGFFNAVIAGATAVGSAKEFADSGNSKKMVESSSAFEAAGYGGKSNAERIALIEQVEGETDKYGAVESVDKELDKILKDLDKFKENEGYTDQNTRINIRTQLSDRIKDNSSTAVDAVDEILDHYHVPPAGEDGGIRESLKQFCGKKALYDQIAAHKEAGGTTAQFVAMSMGMTDKEVFLEEAYQAATAVPKTQYGNVQTIDELKEQGQKIVEDAQVESVALQQDNETKKAEDAAAVADPENGMTQEEADEREAQREADIKKAQHIAGISAEDAFFEKQTEEAARKIMEAASGEVAIEIMKQQEEMYRKLEADAAGLEKDAQEQIQRKLDARREQIKETVEQKISLYVRQKQSQLDAATAEEFEKYQKILEASQNAIVQKQADYLRRRIERVKNNN